MYVTFFFFQFVLENGTKMVEKPFETRAVRKTEPMRQLFLVWYNFVGHCLAHVSYVSKLFYKYAPM